MSNFAVDLTNPYSLSDSLNAADPSDVFNFSLNNPSSVELSVTGLTAPIYYQLQGSGEILDMGTLASPAPAPLTFEGLQTGDYTLQLLQGGEDTDYTIGIDPLTGLTFQYRADLSVDLNNNDDDPSPYSYNVFNQRNFNQLSITEEGISFVFPS